MRAQDLWTQFEVTFKEEGSNVPPGRWHGPEMSVSMIVDRLAAHYATKTEETDR